MWQKRAKMCQKVPRNTPPTKNVPEKTKNVPDCPPRTPPKQKCARGDRKCGRAICLPGVAPDVWALRGCAKITLQCESRMCHGHFFWSQLQQVLLLQIFFYLHSTMYKFLWLRAHSKAGAARAQHPKNPSTSIRPKWRVISAPNVPEREQPRVIERV